MIARMELGKYCKEKTISQNIQLNEEKNIVVSLVLPHEKVLAFYRQLIMLLDTIVVLQEGNVLLRH